MRQVSLGMYSLRREPLKTYSTTASDRPALCRKGRNCLAFCVSYEEKQTGRHLMVNISSPSDTFIHTSNADSDKNITNQVGKNGNGKKEPSQIKSYQNKCDRLNMFIDF